MKDSRWWMYRGAIQELARKELRLRYNRSWLGWLWSFLTPAAVVLIYIVVFGIFLRITPPAGGNGSLRSYGLFLISGYVVWDLFSVVVAGSIAWLAGARPLIRSMPLPPDLPVVAGAVSALAQTGSQIAILFVAFTVVGNIGFESLLAPVFLLGVLMFSLGIGLVVAALQVQFRDTQHVLNIVLTMLFFLTPIVYPLSLVPEQIWGWFPIHRVVELNPLTGFVEAVRGVLYGLDVPSVVDCSILLMSAGISLALGYRIFDRLRDQVTDAL